MSTATADSKTSDSRQREPLDQDRIINSAVGLLDLHAPDKLTLTMIANVLGVTQPALYKHVSGLDEVWRGLGLRERAELTRRLTDAAVGIGGEEAVRALAEAWRQFALDLPTLYGVGTRYPVAGDPELEAAVDGVIAVIVAALRSFDLDDDERMHAAVALRSALHGFCAFELGDGNPSPLDSNDAFTHTIELFLVGLRALASGSIAELQEA